MQAQPTFVKRLTGAGMPETQAEIIAMGQARRNEYLATQPDLFKR